jgi:hypothetical protein
MPQAQHPQSGNASQQRRTNAGEALGSSLFLVTPFDRDHRLGDGPDRPGGLFQDRGQRVQCPGDPVVAPHIGLHTQGVRDGELAGPLPEVDHRGRRGQPVGDHRRDDLPVCGVGDVRTGAARSTMPAMSSRRHTAATTGNAPRVCSELAGP